MAENGAPPRKRMRYNLRTSDDSNSSSSTTTRSHRSTRYMLRSTTRANDGKVEHVELIELKRKRRKNLMALHSDCLLKIFEYMKVADLCNMAEVCESMYNLARYFFRLKYKRFDVALLFEEDGVHIDKLERLLRIFGDQISSLNISREMFANIEHTDISYKILSLVNRYCRHITKELTLEGFADIMQDGWDVMAPLFSTLETLILEDCTMDHVDWCAMDNLQVLHLDGVVAYWEHETLPSNLQKLQELHLNDLEMYENSLTALLLTAPALKRISIVRCWEISTSTFGVISELKSLEEFEFQINRRNHSEEVFQRHLIQLTTLKNLKVLKLNCNKMSVLPLLQGFITKGIALEHLELSDGTFDLDIAKGIAMLKAIKVLKLNGMNGFAEGYISTMTEGLKHLEELHIKTDTKLSQFRTKEIVREANRLSVLKIDIPNFSLNVDTYRSMLTTLQKRIEQKQLQITIYCVSELLTVPDEMLQPSKLLIVKKLNRNYNHLFPLHDWMAADDDDFDMDAEMFVLEFDEGGH